MTFGCPMYTSSTTQGGGVSFKNRKPIGEVGCCESRMAERIHGWTERWLELCFLEWLQWSPHPQMLDIFIYPSIYLSVYLSICLSASLKAKQLCQTSSIFEFDNIKIIAILWDFLQKWKVECRADGLVPMRFAIFPLHLCKVLRLKQK